jgi:aerobic-type carbon monoxide dehydrogenase small subunit (CoxS/CutS family)
MIEVDLTVNGRLCHAVVDPKMSLLRYLRDDLRLCRTKQGCSTGDCGSCVVLVDGKPEDSCLFNIRRANRIAVETVESLSSPGCPLPPRQAAFLECGAVQCGFCTPGMIMAAKAQVKCNPSPDETAIREALQPVVCRCTGYIQIFEAVAKAAHWRRC